MVAGRLRRVHGFATDVVVIAAAVVPIIRCTLHVTDAAGEAFAFRFDISVATAHSLANCEWQRRIVQARSASLAAVCAVLRACVSPLSLFLSFSAAVTRACVAVRALPSSCRGAAHTCEPA